MTELRNRIQTVVSDEPVAVFMKGTPGLVMCGNRTARSGPSRGRRAGDSGQHPPRPANPPGALGSLRVADGPQVFIRGELVGGADIVEELAESGELEEKLTQALGPDYRQPEPSERVVDVLAP